MKHMLGIRNQTLCAQVASDNDQMMNLGKEVFAVILADRIAHHATFGEQTVDICMDWLLDRLPECDVNEWTLGATALAMYLHNLCPPLCSDVDERIGTAPEGRIVGEIPESFAPRSSGVDALETTIWRFVYSR